MTHTDMGQETYLPQPGNFTGDRITDINTLFPVEAQAEVEIKVQDLLAKAGLTEAVIYNYKKAVEEFKGLERIPEGDQHLLTRIKAIDRELTNKRNIITKICDAGKKPLNIWRNAWIATEKQYTREFEQIEAPLKKLLADYKAEQERKEQEEKRRLDELRHERYIKLELLSFARRYRVDGTQVYFLGDTEFEVKAIDVADHETFSNMVTSARMVAEEIRAAKEEQERKAQEAARLLAEQQEAMRKQQQELEAQRLELERQKEEIEAQRRRVDQEQRDQAERDEIAAIQLAKEAQEEVKVLVPESAKDVTPEKVAKVISEDLVSRMPIGFGEWTPISEALVQYATTYIIATDGGEVTCGYAFREGENTYWNNELVRSEYGGDPMRVEGTVTHIMALPEHPNSSPL